LVVVAVGVLSCLDDDVLHEYGESVSWAEDGTLYFTAFADGYDALYDIGTPYRVLPSGEIAEIDRDEVDDCWVADTVQAMASDRIILAGGCGFKPEYRVVSYDLSSQSAERVAEWRIEGWKDLKIWTAWSADTTRSFEASGWLSYTKEGCSSIARIENYRFEPLEGLSDRFEVDDYNKLDYQEIECWQGFQAGQIVVSSTNVVAMLAAVGGDSMLLIHNPITNELAEFPLAAEATGLSFCGPGGDIAVAVHGSEPAIVLIDPADGDSRTIVDGAFDQISCSPDGETIAVIDVTVGANVRLVEAVVA